MSVARQAQIRTRNFSRVLGPFYVVAGSAVAVRATAMCVMLADFASSSVLPWVTGAFVLMAFPDACVSLANHLIGATAAWQGVSLVGAVIGAYLTYVGWVAKPAQAAAPAADTLRDLPRAA